MLLLTGPICDNTPQRMLVTQSISYNTHVASKSTNYNTSFISGNFAPCQLYQLVLSQYIYQNAKEKEVYQIDKEEFGDHLKGFYTTLEHETKEGQYSDKGFDKVDTNFVGIESLCDKYRSSFFTKSQLHKHLRDDYTGLIRSLLPAAFELALLIPIIKSKAVLPTMGSGLAF